MFCYLMHKVVVMKEKREVAKFLSALWPNQSRYERLSTRLTHHAIPDDVTPHSDQPECHYLSPRSDCLQ